MQILSMHVPSDSNFCLPALVHVQLSAMLFVSCQSVKIQSADVCAMASFANVLQHHLTTTLRLG